MCLLERCRPLNPDGRRDERFPELDLQQAAGPRDTLVGLLGPLFHVDDLEGAGSRHADDLLMETSVTEPIVLPQGGRPDHPIPCNE